MTDIANREQVEVVPAFSVPADLLDELRDCAEEITTLHRQLLPAFIRAREARDRLWAVTGDHQVTNIDGWWELVPGYETMSNAAIAIDDLYYQWEREDPEWPTLA